MNRSLNPLLSVNPSLSNTNSPEKEIDNLGIHFDIQFQLFKED